MTAHSCPPCADVHLWTPERRPALPTDRFEDALQKLAHDFAMQVVELIRTTTLDELTTLAKPPEPRAKTEAKPTTAPEKTAKRRGRPPKKAAATPAKVKTAKTSEAPKGKAKTKAKKERAWPTCSVEGCGKRMYPGSGKNRLCYGHHLDAGGKLSPLVLAARKKKLKKK